MAGKISSSIIREVFWRPFLFLFLIMVSSEGAISLETDLDEGTVTVDSMDKSDSWTVKTDGRGSLAQISSVPDPAGTCLSVSFNLVPNGYIGISRNLDLKSLGAGEKIRFSYRGSGAPNTLELRLVDRDGTTYRYPWNAKTSAPEWTVLEASLDDFECLRRLDGTECQGKKLYSNSVGSMNFIIYNWQGDQSGSGTVLLDQVESS